VRERMGDVTLVVIGDGPLRDDLEEYAKECGVASSVRMVGRMPQDTLGAAVKASDVFVLNTAYEGMSHQLLEVMDLGVPIVTTSVGGNTELITDGINGLLVNYDDSGALTEAIVRVLKNEHLRTGMVQHARLRVKDFDRSIVVNELAELFKAHI